MKNPERELAEIKGMMERSTRFISLSGLSGILAGVYALIAASIAYYWIYYPNSPFGYQHFYIDEQLMLNKLLIMALIVLIMSVFTALVLSMQKSKKAKLKLWSSTSKRFFISLAVPLAAGGLLCAALIFRGYAVIVAPATLIFYGLALLNASHYTLSDIKYLAYCQIALGLINAFLPGYGLVFWTFGFGILHIIYGSIMHFKYDR